MLCLRRRPGENVVIRIAGEEICTVTLNDVRGGQAGVGFTGPDRVEFVRGELLEGEEGDRELEGESNAAGAGPGA